MARISDLLTYNSNKFDNMKIKTASDETVLLSSSEVKEILTKYLNDELDFFAKGITKETKSALTERVNFRLKQIESSLVRHVDDKINGITEKIVSLSTNRVIEEEVNRRVEARLKKIKDSL